MQKNYKNWNASHNFSPAQRVVLKVFSHLSLIRVAVFSFWGRTEMQENIYISTNIEQSRHSKWSLSSKPIDGWKCYKCTTNRNPAYSTKIASNLICLLAPLKITTWAISVLYRTPFNILMDRLNIAPARSTAKGSSHSLLLIIGVLKRWAWDIFNLILR